MPFARRCKFAPWSDVGRSTPRPYARKVAVPTEQGHIPITVSIGGAHSDLIEDPLAAGTLLKVADHYLYDAKRAGRNRCMFVPVGAAAGDEVKAGVQTTRSR